MASVKGGLLQTQNDNSLAQKKATQSVAVMVGALVDSEGYRKRFDELLGARSAQFIGSIVSMINADANLQEAFKQAPITIIQSALKAATFDLPIDQSLGYAYIVPFNNKIRGTNQKRMEASFILGYKGMLQLALRTGAYQTINVVDIREGELKKYNRLTEEVEIDFLEDEAAREKLPIIGWCGYFKMINGMTKTIYMSKNSIELHEKKNRKGQFMGKGWREDFDSMAAKTVLRRLIGKWGLMSIDYQKADKKTLVAAESIARGQFDDDDILLEDTTTIDVENSENQSEEESIPVEIDPETGEVLPENLK